MEVSKREYDYLTVIKKYNDNGNPAKIARIAKDMNIAPSSVFEEISHLTEKNLVKKEKDGIWITESGEREYEEWTKTHRVVETLLVKIGFDEKSACDISKKFDYMIPEEVMEKLYVYLGRPKKCPHGGEIP